MRFALLFLLLLGARPTLAADARPVDSLLRSSVEGPQRSADFIHRDKVRHPLEELAFFGIRPNAAIVEIWPGTGYWTEILAPYLHDHGAYGVAIPAGDLSPAAERINDKLRQKLAADPTIYGKVRQIAFGKDHANLAPANSLDFVLTFRNLHDWMSTGWADAALASFYKALKPGGILGFEEHRGRKDIAQDPMAQNGYVRQDYVIAMAKKAGFELVGSSEINANPKDTKDYPKGVWTLPPTFALGPVDRDKYAAIGEGDNMVLKFRKPNR